MNKEYKWSGLAQVFSYLALLGFITSLVVHVAGLMGKANPFGWNPMFLHGGIFVVFLPAVLLSQQLMGRYPEKDAWKIILRGCPQWMKNGMYVVFAYGVLNFIIFSIFTERGSDEGSAIRGYSGHWLIFYYTSFTILQSYIQVAKNVTERWCKNGHLVSALHNHCPECGEHVGIGFD